LSDVGYNKNVTLEIFKILTIQLCILILQQIFLCYARKELKRSSDELLDTIREDKREIKDKIDHEYTGETD
jgi:hypothetical protein